jgi:hypothetical protein
MSATYAIAEKQLQCFEKLRTNGRATLLRRLQQVKFCLMKR